MEGLQKKNYIREPVGKQDRSHAEFWERGQRVERQITLWLCSGLSAICRTLTHKTHTHALAQPFAQQSKMHLLEYFVRLSSYLL